MADRPAPFIAEDEERVEPGYGLALLAVVVMLIVTAVLCLLIYGLMVAISPLEQRGTTRPTVVQVPAPPSQSPTPPQPLK
jgi:hypothetical protein